MNAMFRPVSEEDAIRDLLTALENARLAALKAEDAGVAHRKLLFVYGCLEEATSDAREIIRDIEDERRPLEDENAEHRRAYLASVL